VVADLVALGERLRSDRPNVSLFLVDHSMGSFALQQALVDRSDLYAGVVLSGTTALDVLAASLSASGGASGDLSAFNAGFEYRTGYEWLSRDEAEVDKYVADPLSGFALEEATIPALLGGAAGRP
jgi:alpha-beta hydrolase superfamily lysophospholipase